MPSAGHLKDGITLQRRGTVPDGYGNEQAGPWEEVFTVAARITASLRRETVTASRLQGLNPIDVRVRWSSQTAGIKTEWQAVDVRDPNRILAILSVTDPE